MLGQTYSLRMRIGAHSGRYLSASIGDPKGLLHYMLIGKDVNRTAQVEPMAEPGKVVVKHGITLIGHTNVPSRVAEDASLLYARNLLAFLAPLVDGETGELKIDWEDEIVQGACLTRDGAVIHPLLKEEGA